VIFLDCPVFLMGSLQAGLFPPLFFQVFFFFIFFPFLFRAPLFFPPFARSFSLILIFLYPFFVFFVIFVSSLFFNQLRVFFLFGISPHFLMWNFLSAYFCFFFPLAVPCSPSWLLTPPSLSFFRCFLHESSSEQSFFDFPLQFLLFLIFFFFYIFFFFCPWRPVVTFFSTFDLLNVDFRLSPRTLFLMAQSFFSLFYCSLSPPRGFFVSAIQCLVLSFLLSFRLNAFFFLFFAFLSRINLFCLFFILVGVLFPMRWRGFSPPKNDVEISFFSSPLFLYCLLLFCFDLFLFSSFFLSFPPFKLLDLPKALFRLRAYAFFFTTSTLFYFFFSVSSATPNSLFLFGVHLSLTPFALTTPFLPTLLPVFASLCTSYRFFLFFFRLGF